MIFIHFAYLSNTIQLQRFGGIFKNEILWPGMYAAFANLYTTQHLNVYISRLNIVRCAWVKATSLWIGRFHYEIKRGSNQAIFRSFRHTDSILWLPLCLICFNCRSIVIPSDHVWRADWHYRACEIDRSTVSYKNVWPIRNRYIWCCNEREMFRSKLLFVFFFFLKLL